MADGVAASAEGVGDEAFTVASEGGEAFAANEAAGVEETLLSVFARGCDEDKTSLGAGGDASFTLGGILRAQYPLIKEYGLNYIGLHIMI